jgi:hypothetical protein
VRRDLKTSERDVRRCFRGEFHRSHYSGPRRHSKFQDFPGKTRRTVRQPPC